PRYHYVLENYKHLATVMGILSNEEFERRQMVWKESRDRRETQGRYSYNVHGIPEPSAEPLTDEEKYALINDFLGDKKIFVEKLNNIRDKLDVETVPNIMQEFESLQKDVDTIRLLQETTKKLAKMSRDVCVHNYNSIIPFQYSHATYN